MITHKLYKHVRNKDIALFPLVITEVPEGLLITCKWFNIVNTNNIYDIGVSDKVTIKFEDLQNWEKL